MTAVPLPQSRVRSSDSLLLVPPPHAGRYSLAPIANAIPSRFHSSLRIGETLQEFPCASWSRHVKGYLSTARLHDNDESHKPTTLSLRVDQVTDLR